MPPSARGCGNAVALPTGGSLRIELNGVASGRLPSVLDPATPDHRLLACCLNLADAGTETVLVTKDTALRIKGAQLGLEVQDYRADTVPVEELHSGINELHGRGRRSSIASTTRTRFSLTDADAMVNQFLVLRNGSQSALARVIQSDPETVVERVPNHLRVFGIEPKNLRQTVALHLMMDPDIPAVSVMGMAGTGKTFLALAAALEQVLEMAPLSTGHGVSPVDRGGSAGGRFPAGRSR